ncbi:hypothetical protein SAMN05443667_11262 [Flavobacterium gillisiae]|uniref:Uncharacterized protein n=1 Tax=Flavobacterium gillisiae TaxID=150146 RepID=A0A1H4F7A2_9FLAO|nr:hypothetical protein SAMN05443667_11262 [Flavobacterium gillisiae]
MNSGQRDYGKRVLKVVNNIADLTKVLTDNPNVIGFT